MLCHFTEGLTIVIYQSSCAYSFTNVLLGPVEKRMGRFHCSGISGAQGQAKEASVPGQSLSQLVFNLEVKTWKFEVLQPGLDHFTWQHEPVDTQHKHQRVILRILLDQLYTYAHLGTSCEQ